MLDQLCYGVVAVAAVLLLLSWYALYRLRRQAILSRDQLKRLQEIASVDSLTLIYNRHMLDDLLQKQIAFSERYRQFFSIIFFDIDDFKVINDRYGHAVGDDVLVTLAELVRASLRQSDIFGRWGGDEFLILLPESTGKQATRLVALLNNRIEQSLFPRGMSVSCSFGTASYQYGDDPKEIIARADKELYKAKAKRKQGRQAPGLR